MLPFLRLLVPNAFLVSTTQRLSHPLSRIDTLQTLRSPSALLQVRFATYGQEYQPSTLRRKRRYGFLKRLRTIGGRKILQRRMMKGRKYLTH